MSNNSLPEMSTPVTTSHITEINKRINSLFFSEHPVSSILEINFQVNINENSYTDVALKDLVYSSFISKLHREFREQLLIGVNVSPSVKVIVPFLEVHKESRHFTCTSSHNDYVKDFVLRTIVKNCNKRWNTPEFLSPFSCILNVSMDYVLSRPVNYRDME